MLLICFPEDFFCLPGQHGVSYCSYSDLVLLLTSLKSCLLLPSTGTSLLSYKIWDKKRCSLPQTMMLITPIPKYVEVTESLEALLFHLMKIQVVFTKQQYSGDYGEPGTVWDFEQKTRQSVHSVLKLIKEMYRRPTWGYIHLQFQCFQGRGRKVRSSRSSLAS